MGKLWVLGGSLAWPRAPHYPGVVPTPNPHPPAAQISSKQDCSSATPRAHRISSPCINVKTIGRKMSPLVWQSLGHVVAKDGLGVTDKVINFHLP